MRPKMAYRVARLLHPKSDDQMRTNDMKHDIVSPMTRTAVQRVLWMVFYKLQLHVAGSRKETNFIHPFIRLMHPDTWTKSNPGIFTRLKTKGVNIRSKPPNSHPVLYTSETCICLGPRRH